METKKTMEVRPPVTEHSETRGLKICTDCAFEMREGDRFCRRCGTRWSATAAQLLQSSQTGATSVKTGRLPSTVLPTAVLPQHEAYRPVSGSLLNAVAASVSSVSAQLPGKVTGKLLAALLSLPIWLIIIVLSPFDAVLASKTLLRQF